MKIFENIVSKHFTKILMNELVYQLKREYPNFKFKIIYNNFKGLLFASLRWKNDFILVYDCNFKAAICEYCHAYFEIVKEIKKGLEKIQHEK